MKNMKTLCFTLAAICSVYSCKENPFVERVYGIKVQNNANFIINYLVSYNYPDTIIPDQYNSLRGGQPMSYGYIDSTHIAIFVLFRHLCV